VNLKRRLLYFTFPACLSFFFGAASPAQVTGISDDFSDGDYDFWSVDDPGNWEVVDAVLRQKKAVNRSGSWLSYFARMDSFLVDGDFTLTVRLGFNPEAYPMSGSSQVGGDIYRRSYAFGIMADNNNALLATFLRSSGSSNGILKIAGGGSTMLYSPYSGQGMGLEVHNIREMKMSRRSEIITVHADGRVIYQAGETAAPGAPASGRAVVCSRGPVGLALDEIELTATAPPPPTWTGPPQITEFTFYLEENTGHRIWSDYQSHHGTVEVGGSGPGSFFGWWVQDGAGEDSKSWAAAGGQLTITDYSMGPQATLEGWFKFLDTGPDYGVPIFHLMFEGSLIDATWGRERGGPVLLAKDGGATLHFHEFGWATAEDMGDITLGEWTHIAWVRDGSLHTFYIDGEEVGAVEIPRYGETILTGIQINVANNADHDWLTGLGSAYLYVDKIRATGRALAPDEFIVAEDVQYIVNGHPAWSCDFNEDGRKNITDVIALLLAARDNPDDPRVDINEDGAWSVADAIALLLHIRDNTCPDG